MSADVKIPSDLQMCCPDCAGNGEVDSGGTTPQGSAIFLCCPRCGGEGSIIKDNPNLEEHLDRLDAMISNDGQWDWSDNDIEALKGIRDELRIQCAYNRLLTADRDLWQRKCELMASAVTDEELNVFPWPIPIKVVRERLNLILGGRPQSRVTYCRKCDRLIPIEEIQEHIGHNADVERALRRLALPAQGGTGEK